MKKSESLARKIFQNCCVEHGRSYSCDGPTGRVEEGVCRRRMPMCHDASPAGRGEPREGRFHEQGMAWRSFGCRDDRRAGCSNQARRRRPSPALLFAPRTRARSWRPTGDRPWRRQSSGPCSATRRRSQAAAGRWHACSGPGRGALRACFPRRGAGWWSGCERSPCMQGLVP